MRVSYPGDFHHEIGEPFGSVEPTDTPCILSHCGEPFGRGAKC